MTSEFKKNLLGIIMMYFAFIIIYLNHPSETTDPKILADAALVAPLMWGFFLLIPIAMLFICAILEGVGDALPGGKSSKGNTYLIVSSLALFLVLIEG